MLPDHRRYAQYYNSSGVTFVPPASKCRAIRAIVHYRLSSVWLRHNVMEECRSTTALMSEMRTQIPLKVARDGKHSTCSYYFRMSIDTLSVQVRKNGNLQRLNVVWWLRQSRGGYMGLFVEYIQDRSTLTTVCTVYVRASYILRPSIMDHSDNIKAGLVDRAGFYMYILSQHDRPWPRIHPQHFLSLLSNEL